MKNIHSDNSLIVVVTYNPNDTISRLLDSLTAISNKVIVVDNGSANKSVIEATCKSRGCKFLGCDNNNGIAGAINKGIRLGLSSEIDWIITFDQDSLPPINLLDYYNVVIAKESNVGLVGLSYDYTVSQGRIHEKVRYKKTYDQITSGLLHNAKMWKDIGGYNEQYFIDCVDFEYSLRVASNGYDTFTIGNKVLQHSLGSPKTKRIFGVNVTSMNHNAFRHYYIVRNHIFLAKQYFKRFPFFILIKFYHLNNRLIKMLLIDDDRMNKLRQSWRGWMDGVKTGVS